MKKFRVVFVTVVLLFSFSACSGDIGENGSSENGNGIIEDPMEDPSEDPSEEPSEEPTEEPSEEPTEEPLVFTEEQALELEQEFEERLYQETTDSEGTQDDDSDEPLVVYEEVRNFNSKDELLDHLAEIMDRELASDYIDTYYEEENSKLYLIPKDGATLVVDNEPYDFEKIDEGRYKLTQQIDSEMIGLYTITITYQYMQEKQAWIIAERDVETQQ